MNKNKKYFWSYDTKADLSKNIIVENTLKYGDLVDINQIIIEYGLEFCKNIWINNIISDTRFKKLNYFLARFIFCIDDNHEYINNYLSSMSKSRNERITQFSHS